MRNFFFILLFSFSLIANAQTINQNVKYTKVAAFTGKPIVQDTALLIKNGSDTLRITGNSINTKQKRALTISSDSSVSVLVGDTAFLEIKAMNFNTPGEFHNGFRLGTTSRPGHFCGVHGNDKYWTEADIHGFSAIGIWDSVVGGMNITEYAPGQIESEIISGSTNVVVKLTPTTFNVGSYYSDEEWINYDTETGLSWFGNNGYNDAVSYYDTIAKTITEVCDGGFVVKNHSDNNLANCDSLNIVISSTAATISSNKTITIAGPIGAPDIPSYPNNAAAVSAIGAGKLYYTDTAGEYIIKLSH